MCACMTTLAERFTRGIRVLPRLSARKVLQVMDLKHCTISQSSLAVTADSAIEFDHLCAEFCPLLFVIKIWHWRHPSITYTSARSYSIADHPSLRDWESVCRKKILTLYDMSFFP